MKPGRWLVRRAPETRVRVELSRVNDPASLKNGN